ncbi:MAG TPA: FeoA family protein [Methylomirabilota bacterium]|nr:FeoA family protein [Methylomirabilota bacterium]
MPGHTRSSPRERRLATLEAGARAAISRVSEVAEREAPLLLAYLLERGLIPGRAVHVVEVDEVGRRIRIRAGRREVTLSHDTAAKLWVMPT